MKLTWNERMYGWVIAIILAGIVVHAPLSVFLGTVLPDYQLLIKSWKEILIIFAGVLAVISITKRHLWRELIDDLLMRLILAYVFLHFLLALVLHNGLVATSAGLLIDLRYIAYFVLVYVLIKIAPQYRLRLLIITAVGAMVVVGFGILQLFLPVDILTHIGYSTDTIAPYLTVDKNPDFVRINSTLRGPNPLGAYMVIVLAVIASLLIKQRDRLKSPTRRWVFVVMAIGSAIVLWVSYSRSALVAGVFAVATVMALTYGRRVSRQSWLIAGAIAIVLIGSLFALRNTNLVANVILHDNPTTGAKVTSNSGHISSLAHGTERVVHRPLGAGIGSTGSASLYGDEGLIIENQYLFIAHETGWLGVILFVWINAMILWRAWRQRQDWLSAAVFSSGIGLALIGLLLPVWADDTVSLVWWGLAAIALASGGIYGTKPSNKKTA